jgi:osmotically-inducible protein OsmY
VKKAIIFIGLLGFLIPHLSGCTAVVGAGATVGVTAFQERGIKGRAKDLKIEAMVLESFISEELLLLATIGVEVYESRVLLTGASKDKSITDKAIKLSWAIEGVKEVINEIQTHNSTNIIDFSKDSWITAQMRSKLTFDINVYSINYSIETVNGTVYLIGIAQDDTEHNIVKQYASQIKFVNRVISHVRMKTK